MNGMIEGDRNLSPIEHLICVDWNDVNEANYKNCLNIWPTGVSFLGGFDLPKSTKVLKYCEKPYSSGQSATPNIHEQLKRYLLQVDAPYMRIRSLDGATQNTSWTSESSHINYLAPPRIARTRAALEKFATKDGVSCVGENYEVPVMRFMHRLCAFFMGFVSLGTDLYWMSYCPERVTRARVRHKIALEDARKVLPKKSLSSPAWKLVELYASVAEFLMCCHEELIFQGNYGLGYLNTAVSKSEGGTKLLDFFALGESRSAPFTREHILASSEVYHRFRDTFGSEQPVDPKHRFVDGLFALAGESRDGFERRDSYTIGGLQRIWTRLVGDAFPDFNENVEDLIREI